MAQLTEAQKVKAVDILSKHFMGEVDFEFRMARLYQKVAKENGRTVSAAEAKAKISDKYQKLLIKMARQTRPEVVDYMNKVFASSIGPELKKFIQVSTQEFKALNREIIKEAKNP
tara:strand:- start:221 stop:565 length:345 start_codon:yes stop_codon:yes gene_type:complete